VPLEPCTASFDENGGNDPHFVPHYLPGKNPYLTEWLETQKWIPEEAARGGLNTIYPGYQPNITTRSPVVAAKSAVNANERIAAQGPRDGQVHVMPVQRNVYMLIADGSNITASVGPEGVLMVDTGSAAMTEKTLAAINQLAKDVAASPHPNQCLGVSCSSMPFGWSSVYMAGLIGSPAPARPVRYIINTSVSPEHTGGNEKFAKVGFHPRGGGEDAMRIAHQNTFFRMSGASGEKALLPEGGWANETYHRDMYKLSEYFNGEPVVVYHVPNAHTDGDSIVYFRHSEVISAGNVFSTVSYPVIDLAKGGTLQGTIDALATIIDLAVPEARSQGGTWIIPGHGRLSDTADVASYRNMLVMIRDRVQDLIKSGMSLQQVKAAKPTRDFDGRYGSTTGSWTTEMFIEAVYRSLTK